MKQLYLEACRLNDEMSRLFEEGVTFENDPNGTLHACFNAYIDLVNKHDFTNKVYQDENGKFGVVNCLGEVLIRAKYDQIKYFDQAGIPPRPIQAIAREGDHEWLVGSHLIGEILYAKEIRPHLASISPVTFRDGDKWNIACAEGFPLLQFGFDKITPDANDFWWISLDGKEGFIAPGFDIIWPEFDSVKVGSDQRIIVTKDGREGYVDEDGEFTTDPDRAYYRFDLVL